MVASNREGDDETECRLSRYDNWTDNEAMYACSRLKEGIVVIRIFDSVFCKPGTPMVDVERDCSR